MFSCVRNELSFIITFAHSDVSYRFNVVLESKIIHSKEKSDIVATYFDGLIFGGRKRALYFIVCEVYRGFLIFSV